MKNISEKVKRISPQISPNDRAAKRLLENLPDELRVAVESMRRVIRSKKDIQTEHENHVYHKVF
ncbi:MAG: hypothetical protein WC058_05210 [Phycisphaeraceae bacterium]